MIRASPRAVLRSSHQLLSSQSRISYRHQRRYLSFITPPAERPRSSFKNFVARCAIAGGAAWWFMNTDVFADDGGYVRKQKIPETPAENEQYASVDDLAEARRQNRLAASQGVMDAASPVDDAGGAADLEEEAQSQGAFNEETGEINWDCPCLGGMAHGPCGPEFREAFSCFVYSKEEPKGVECIDRFKGMQDCFRLHPDVYGAELTDEPDEEGDEIIAPAQDQNAEGLSGPSDTQPLTASKQQSSSPSSAQSETHDGADPVAAIAAVPSNTLQAIASTSETAEDVKEKESQVKTSSSSSVAKKTGSTKKNAQKE